MSKSLPLYLLLGPEEGEKEAFIERLLEGLSREAAGGPEVHRFYAFENALPEALSVLRNGTLFGGHRVVLLRGAEELNRKSDLDMLAAYAQRPAPGATLVLASPEVGRVDDRLKKLVPREGQKIFWELFENQKMGWISSFFRRHGLEIDPEAAGFLLEMVENNTRDLRDTCGKLALYLGARAARRIELEDVEELLYHSKEENVFTLFERMSVRDFGASLEVLDKILLSRETDAVQLLGGLLSQYRKLLSLKLLTGQRHPLIEAGARLGIRGKRNQKLYAEALRHYSVGELEGIIRLVALYDRRARELKSALHPCLLGLFVYHAVHGEGSTARPRR
ncbi:MAG: DNA polymerase III subunit delta [Spirochaetales bacterium]|nr:DNA polymerase III subunit delta [Spirochaetales bacterium]